MYWFENVKKITYFRLERDIIKGVDVIKVATGAGGSPIYEKNQMRYDN